MLADAHRYAWRRCKYHPRNVHELSGQPQSVLWAQWRNRLYFLECSRSHQVGLQQGKRVLFFPDEHLGRNTAIKYGISAEQMVVWDPKDPMASDTADEEIERAKIILWKGHCTTICASMSNRSKKHAQPIQASKYWFTRNVVAR